MGRQPRGKLSPLLLSEFKHKIVVQSSHVTVPRAIFEDVPAPFQGTPPVSCVFSPDEFIDRAALLKRPLDSPQLVDQANLEAMVAIRDWSASDVATFRRKRLKHYMALAMDLMDDEKCLSENMDHQVNSVLGGKRLKLFQRMCEDADVGCFRNLRKVSGSQEP